MTGSTANANISLGSSLQLHPQTQREVRADAALPTSVRFLHRWKYFFVLIPIAIALAYLFTMQPVLTNRQNLAIRVEKAEGGGSVSNVNSTGGMLLRPSAHFIANATKCSFCEGKGGIPNLDLVVPRTSGNTCGSIKLMAAEKVNGSDICAIIQKEENVCCSVLYGKSSSSLESYRNQQSADFDGSKQGDWAQEIVKHVSRHGRLGNQLFEHAATLAIAKASGKQACVIGTNAVLIDRYFTDGVFLRNCTNIVPSENVSETGYGIFSPLPKTDRSLEIFGYFQSWKYFAGAEAEAEIMRAFTLKPKYSRDADEIIGKGGHATNYYNVGIHMRWFEGYLIEPPKEYYQSAMEHFRSKYEEKNKRVRFYLASSDIEKTKKLGIFTDESVVVLNNQQAIIDFAVLMSCDGMILSSGTFGWWAAWLGAHQRNGEVLYFSFSDVFDMDNRKNKGQVNKGDYYPPNWKEIAPETLLSFNTSNGKHW